MGGRGVPTRAFKNRGLSSLPHRGSPRRGPHPTSDPQRRSPTSPASPEVPGADPSSGGRRAACYVTPAPRRQAGPLLRLRPLLLPEQALHSGRFVKALGAFSYFAAGQNPRPSVLPAPHADPAQLAMPENVAPRSGAPAAAAGGRYKSAYQDRDKPAQIRFSNISAAKGIAPGAQPAALRGRALRSRPAFGWSWFSDPLLALRSGSPVRGSCYFLPITLDPEYGLSAFRDLDARSCSARSLPLVAVPGVLTVKPCR